MLCFLACLHGNPVVVLDCVAVPPSTRLRVGDVAYTPGSTNVAENGKYGKWTIFKMYFLLFEN